MTHAIHICRHRAEVISTKPGEVRGKCEMTNAETGNRCSRRAQHALRYAWGTAKVCTPHFDEEVAP